MVLVELIELPDRGDVQGIRTSFGFRAAAGAGRNWPEIGGCPFGIRFLFLYMRHFTSYKPRRRLDTHEWYKLILGHVKSESRSSSVSVELTKHLVAGKIVRHPEKGLRPALRR